MYLEKEHTAHGVSSHQSPCQMRISQTVFQIRARGKEQGRESLAATASSKEFSVLGTTARWVRLPAPCPRSRAREQRWRVRKLERFLKWLPRRTRRPATPSPFILVNNSAKRQMALAESLQEPLPQSWGFLPHYCYLQLPRPTLACRRSVCFPQVTACLSEDEQTNSK